MDAPTNIKIENSKQDETEENQSVAGNARTGTRDRDREDNIGELQITDEQLGNFTYKSTRLLSILFNTYRPWR